MHPDDFAGVVLVPLHKHDFLESLQVQGLHDALDAVDGLNGGFEDGEFALLDEGMPIAFETLCVLN